MLEFMTDLTDSFSSILSIAFFFLCVFIAYWVLSKPEIKAFLKRGGFLPLYAATIIFGSLLNAAFSFVIYDTSYLMQRLYQSSFGVTEVFQFLKNAVAIGVFGLGSYLIYRSYQKQQGTATGRYSSSILGMITIFCLFSLTACSSRYVDPWYEIREFLGNANWVLFYFLIAITYVLAGFVSYNLVTIAPISPTIRKYGPIPHILVFCIFTDILHGILYSPIYNLYDSIQGISNQEGFLPIISNMLSAGLFVAGLVYAYRLITNNKFEKHVANLNLGRAPIKTVGDAVKGE